MRRISYALLVAVLGMSLTGCFITSKGKSKQPASSEYKNHGQERKAEVHDRNAERKADKDADKAAK